LKVSGRQKKGTTEGPCEERGKSDADGLPED